MSQRLALDEDKDEDNQLTSLPESIGSLVNLITAYPRTRKFPEQMKISPIHLGRYISAQAAIHNNLLGALKRPERDESPPRVFGEIRCNPKT